MGLFDLFRKKPKQEPAPTKREWNWISPDDNPWNVKLLDLRPFTQDVVSTTQDPQIAENAVSYGGENGRTFWRISPKNTKTIDSRLEYSMDSPLQPGVLFVPKVMEQKWAVFFDGERLIFVRSWLREVLVVAKTRQENDRLIVETITGEFMEDSPPEATNAVLNFLLVSHAMGETVPTPLPCELESLLDQAGIWAFSRYGTFALFGVFDETFLSTPTARLRTDSLLHLAAAKDDVDEINRLAGSLKDLNYLCRSGFTPLHWSLSAETSTAMMKLLELGANPNARSDQNATPLMNAAQMNLKDRALLLIRSGADVNAVDHRGFTALHRACEMGHAEIVALLLEHGADKSISAEGHTAISLAQMRNEQKIVEMLK